MIIDNANFKCNVNQISIDGVATHYDEKIWVEDSNNPEGGEFQIVKKMYDKPKVIFNFSMTVDFELQVRGVYYDGINKFIATSKNQLYCIPNTIDKFELPTRLVLIATTP